MTVRISAQTNLFDYFQERVEEARVDTGAGISDETTLYLAQLLTERARIDAPAAETLVELRARALEARPAEQAKTFRAIGDKALYELGTFKEHLERKVVSLSYYESMGRDAYARTDQVLKRWFADAFGPLFRELADRFDACVAVLSEVKAANPKDALDALYDEWLTTGSEDAARRLRLRGLVVPRRTADA